MDKLPLTFEADVRNPLGFHSRVAARLFQVASGFRSAISFENLTTGAGPNDAKSFSSITGSGTSVGHRVRFTLRGDDQDQAASALRSLADAGFPGTDETNTAATGAEPTETAADSGARTGLPGARTGLPGARTGLPGAPGVVVGPIWVYRDNAAGHADADEEAASSPDELIRAAARTAADQLTALAAAVRAAGNPHEAAILDAQALLANDEPLLAAATERARQMDAPSAADTASAAEATFEEAAASQAALPDERLAARASDFVDVGSRIGRILRGEDLALPPKPSVVVADDLPPSVFAEIPPELLLGVAMERGSATSHVVILARARGVPAVIGVRGLVAAATGTAPSTAAPTATAATAAAGAKEIGIDGGTGEAVLDPSGVARAELRRRARVRFERAPVVPTLSRGLTKDGKHVPLLANISSPAEARRAREAGAEGIGLFRTEFLFMGRSSAPAEDEQADAYRQVFESFGPERAVVVRLADLAGDKQVPYLEARSRETSLAARDADLIRTQLRAIWRAAAEAGVTPHVMVPMVATLADVEQLRLLRDETRAAVAAAEATTAALPARMAIGAMIERPEAVEIARQLAHRLDFFSVGTNDLTVLTLGIDRSDPRFGPESALEPAVLRLISRTVRGADAEGIPVAVCGELAATPIGALALVALGVDELSVDALALDEVRSALARVTRAELEVLGRTVLAAPDAVAVRARVAELLGR